MNRMVKATVAGIVGGAAVFCAVFAWRYFHLLAHQPGVGEQQPVTSFPPSAAWITALPCSLLAFLAVAVGAYVFNKGRAK